MRVHRHARRFRRVRGAIPVMHDKLDQREGTEPTAPRTQQESPMLDQERRQTRARPRRRACLAGWRAGQRGRARCAPRSGVLPKVEADVDTPPHGDAGARPPRSAAARQALSVISDHKAARSGRPSVFPAGRGGRGSLTKTGGEPRTRRTTTALKGTRRRGLPARPLRVFRSLRVRTPPVFVRAVPNAE